MVELGIGLDGVVLRSPTPLELQSQAIAFQPFLTGSISPTNVPEESQGQQVPQWLLEGF